jgi:hypothetical protein
VKLAILLSLLLFTGMALAQSDCAVCEPASKLREDLRKLDIGNPEQKAQGEALSREGLTLITGFRDSVPPPKQGRKSFEALVRLSVFAAPFAASGEYETALATITSKNPDYRKRFQAMLRKGMRARDRRESCQVRYLQTNVSVAECKLTEKGAGATDALAHQRCSASYALDQCMAKKR